MKRKGLCLSVTVDPLSPEAVAPEQTCVRVLGVLPRQRISQSGRCQDLGWKEKPEFVSLVALGKECTCWAAKDGVMRSKRMHGDAA